MRNTAMGDTVVDGTATGGTTVGGIVRSLRFRFAALGFAAIVVPLIALSFVTAATDTETDIVGNEIVTETVGIRGLSPWTWLTVLASAAIAAPVCWWAAGRLVAPIEAIRDTAERIELGGLGQRVSLASGSDELVRLGAAFDDMLARLEAAAKAERRQLAETSHDLRTPLAAIRSTADVLATDPEPTIDRLTDGHRQIADIAARLTDTIEELLVTSRREQHRWADRFDLVALAHAVVDEAAPEAARRRIEIEVVPGQQEPIEAAADGPSLRRAITNLVDNAVRHATSRVTVAVEARPTALRVTVTNDGDPLPEGAPLFEPYWRGDTGTETNTEDETGNGRESADGRRVGLGLSIVAQVAEANGGTVEARARPAPDTGAEFTIELPR